MKTIIMLIISAIFTTISCALIFTTNLNLGNILVYIITILLWVYTILYRKIDILLATDIGKIFKIVFVVLTIAFLCVAVFIFIFGKTSTAKFDEKAIIVLGASVRKEQVSGVLALRLNAAIKYSQQNPSAYIVVAGGKGPEEDISEAEAMKRYLVKYGVNSDKILMEDKSTSTKENFEFSLKILAQKGIGSSEPIAFVTNDFHCYRASKFAQKVGFADIRIYPSATNPQSILPSYLRETLAVLYLWFLT